jgi:hypothetical protein
MEAVRGVIPESGSTGCAGAPGWRAPHLAQYWSAEFTWFPQLLQKGIYLAIRYARPGCSGNHVIRFRPCIFV